MVPSIGHFWYYTTLNFLQKRMLTFQGLGAYSLILT